MHARDPQPFSSIGKDIAGNTTADVAVTLSRRVPGLAILRVPGAVYKVADFVTDLGLTAVERENEWLDAEFILVNSDALRLKQIHDAGGDLHSGAAQAAIERLKAEKPLFMRHDGSNVSYTWDVFVRRFQFSMAHAGLGYLFAATVGYAIDRLGIAALVEEMLPLPTKIRWLLGNNSPLADLERGMGWRKLGDRARLAEAVTRDAMEAVERHGLEAAGRPSLETVFAQDREQSTEALGGSQALTEIYQDVLKAHPSEPRDIIVDDFRLSLAQENKQLLVPAQAAPVAVDPATDPLVRVIESDDAGGWPHYASRSGAYHPSDETATASNFNGPAPSAENDTWRSGLHAEMATVGDGKTFQSCSAGCMSRSESSWDGGNGQTLYGR